MVGIVSDELTVEVVNADIAVLFEENLDRYLVDFRDVRGLLFSNRVLVVSAAAVHDSLIL